jgi:hypothetical protein
MEARPPLGTTAAGSPIGQEFAMARRLRGVFEKLDFFSAFAALLFEARMELKPIPVKVRRRR